MKDCLKTIFFGCMCAFWIAGPLPSGALFTSEAPAFFDGAALLAAIKAFDKRMSGAVDKANQKLDKTNSKIGESNDKLEQIKREAKEGNNIGNRQLAEQWAARIENWTAHVMRYTKLVQQLTTLRGIYQYTMTKMGLDEKTRANLLKWFRHIEAAKRLYNAGINLWNTRWAVMDTLQRIRNFPESFNIREAWSILNDFMDRVYRAEYEAEQKRRVMLERDPKLGLLWEEYGDLQAQLSFVREKIKRVKEELGRLSGDSVSVGTTPPDGQNPVDSVPNTAGTQDQEAMRDLQKRLDDLENQEQALKVQIADKIKAISDLYGQNRVKFDDMTKSANEIRENEQAWGKLIEQADADGERAFRAILNGPSELPDAPSAPALGPR